MWWLCGCQLYATREFPCPTSVSATSSALPRCAVRHGNAGFRTKAWCSRPTAASAQHTVCHWCHCKRTVLLLLRLPSPSPLVVCLCARPVGRHRTTKACPDCASVRLTNTKQKARQDKAAAERSTAQSKERALAREAERGPDLVPTPPLVTVPSPRSDSPAELFWILA
jgi:hypothetical protein